MSISAQRGSPQSWARRFLCSEALPRAGRGDFCATEATSAVPRAREVAGRKSYGIAFAPGDRLALLVVLAPLPAALVNTTAISMISSGDAPPRPGVPLPLRRLLGP